ncbi:MAG: carboxypeptidase-like regulatory domain-containing protein [Planctomycetes bacterium]|nr:carboxypeptidase-like regulatory domain-containing protein [Planctomycetota bacterium]
MVISRDGAPAPAGTTVRLLTLGSGSVDFPQFADAGEEGGSIRGALVDGAWRSYGEVTFGREPGAVATTAADGTFSFEVGGDVPRFGFEATSDFGRTDSVQWHDAGSPEVAAGLTLVLEPAGKVEGTVRGPDGSAPRGGRVMVRSAESMGHGPGWENYRVRCDGEGRFELRGVEPRKYEAVSWAEGLGIAFGPEIEVREGKTERLDLVLPADSWVSGTVVNGEGKGVEGAFVVSTREEDLMTHQAVPPPARIARTDGAGAFRIGSLGAGGHYLTAEFPGLLRARSDKIDVPSPGGVEGVRIVLEQGRSLSGRVVDAEGRPVAGASVRADGDWEASRKRGTGRAFRQSAQRDETGGDGTFRLPGLPDSPLYMEVSLEGRGRTVLGDLEPGREDLLVMLRPCGISGTVRAAGDGRPIAAFSVGAWSRVPQGRPGRRVFPRSFESPDGTFEWLDLGPGPVRVSVSAPGFVPATLEGVEVKDGEVTGGLDVRLARAAEVRGRVVEAGSGAPVAGAKVRWSEVGAPRQPVGIRLGVSTGADGTFLLSGVKAARLRIEADHAEFLPATVETLEVREGERVEGFVLEAQRAGAIEGVAIRADGSPLAGGSVRALPAKTEGVMYGGEGWSADIGADGAFRIGGLRPRKYRVEAWATRIEEWGPAPAPLLRGLAEVEAGRATRVEFREPVAGNCTVRGRVLRAGKGLAGVPVLIAPALAGEDPDLFGWVEDRFRAVAAADGSFEISRVPAGEATLSIGGPSNPASFPLRVPEGGVLVFDAILPSGAIEGSVTRASDGSPVPHAQVGVTAVEGRPFHGGATSDAKGRFRVEGLSPGSYSVRVRTSGWSGSRPRQGQSSLTGGEAGPVVLGEGEVGRADLVLREGGSVGFSVTDPEGKPKAWAYVRIRRSDDSGEPFPGVNYGRCDDQGIATATGLPPGRYVVQASVEGLGQSPTEEVSVTEGAVAESVLRLRPGTLVQVRVVWEPKVPLHARVHFRGAEGWEIWAPSDERRGGPGEAFAEAHLVPGEYTLLARAPGYRDSAVPVRVGVESPQQAVVRLEREPPRK